ncbi:DUF3108 domain-containing protein [Burkholderiaceae bacterium DAT-1]|nr:DUF3108 domain-containing protein [Burkholderiaceae bacterium DAT-1]
MTVRHLLSTLTAILLTSHVLASTLPARARIQYDVLYNGKLKIGTAEQSWSLDDKHYTLETRLKPSLFGPTIRYISHGRMDSQGLIPEDYAEFRNQEGSPRVSARFDSTAHTLQFGDRDDKPQTLSMPKGIQDINAFIFQLSWIGDHREAIDMPVNTGRKQKQHRFTLQTPGSTRLGEQKVLTRVWQSRDNGENTEVWLAPELGNLPIRLIRQDDSKELWLIATKIEIDTP